MNIIIVGCGKVGYTLAKHLSEEANDVVVIDKKQESLGKAQESIDVMTVRGNGLSVGTLIEAGVKNADLIISVTSSDESNILCCLTAKKMGAKYSVARIRDPEYALELSQFRSYMGLDMIINPEQQAAMEISRLLRFPVANDIDALVGGRVELVSFTIAEGDQFADKRVSNLFARQNIPALLGLVERNGVFIIPNGDLILKPDDEVRVIGRTTDVYDYLKQMGKFSARVKDVMIIGGGKITHYLVEILSRFNMKSKIIEIDGQKCISLDEMVPKECLVIKGDGTDEELLKEEDITEMDAVVCLTNMDEENAIVGLYALQCGVPKVVAKINRINPGLVRNLGLDSVISPKNLTAYRIIQYVRSLKKTAHSNIETYFKITGAESQAEALEFHMNHDSKCLNKRLKDLSLKPGILIGCIVHKNNIVIPSGDNIIHEDDSIIIITTHKNITDVDDIMA